MVVKVISGKNIQGALNYNEQKVSQGTAQCILASGFMKEGADMTFYEKLKRFGDLNAHNTRSKTNTLHISLNFDVTEKLDVSKLNTIAISYMNQIGFGDQPYLVYKHNDAAHPHIHIVTTIIRKDGTRIPIHYLGQNKSEPARKQIEHEFNLVVAENKKNQRQSIRKADLTTALYGKTETKRSIAAIVSEVTRTYKYVSIPELNAVLRLYNVEASRGSEKSIMLQKGGLLYQLLNSNGNRVGIPIKASSLPGKPTLAFLEKQFVVNEAARLALREQLKNKIDKALQSPMTNALSDLINGLARHKIIVIPRTNQEGRLYGITFIDQVNRAVFNGSTLGKSYSASAIGTRLAGGEKPIKHAREPLLGDAIYIVSGEPTPGLEKPTNPLIQLVSAEGQGTQSPYGHGLNRKRRRRKRKRL